MAKRSRQSAGFNTPFSGLSLPAEPAPASKILPAPARKASPRLAEPPPHELFMSAVAGTKPLEHNAERVEPAKRASLERENDDALVVAELEELVHGSGEFRCEDSEEFHSGAAPGVSFEIIEKLRHGHFAFRRHLDLHGLSRDEAKAAVTQFVTAARHDGERCILVITGRGRSSPDGISVLRETLPRWLSRSPLRPHVLAYSTARAEDGGPGAYYVLLRRPGVKPYGPAL